MNELEKQITIKKKKVGVLQIHLTTQDEEIHILKEQVKDQKEQVIDKKSIIK